MQKSEDIQHLLLYMYNIYMYSRSTCSSMKNKASYHKMLINYIHWIFYCKIHCISSANLYQVQENHVLKFQFCSSTFSLFFCFFLSYQNKTQKIWCVCEYYTHLMTTLLLGIFLYWFGAAYELRLASYGLETVFKKASSAL